MNAKQRVNVETSCSSEVHTSPEIENNQFSTYGAQSTE
jgi:hypothetical protein